MHQRNVLRSSVLATTLAAAGLILAPTPAEAFRGLFKKPEKQLPPVEQRSQQDIEADAIFEQARAAQAKGDSAKATTLYNSILKQYPFSKAAPEAAYAKAQIVRVTGKLSDAFDAFQRLIADYRSSPRFSDAIEQQFEIAEEAKGGKKQRSLLLIPMKLSTEDVIGMYRTIITNAPFGKYAPMAQFSIGEVYQDRGDRDEAVGAYQMVVENYPKSSQASEAQFRIGAIANIAANRSRDSSNLTATRDALTTYVATNPGGDRATEASEILSKVNIAEAAKSLEIGKFYERRNQPKAAAVYYNEALRYGSAEASTEARERLSKLAAADPDALASVASQAKSDFTVPAAVDLRSQDEYVGPPSPELARLSQKPQMRTEQDDFLPIPLQEPTLPVRPGADTGTTAGTLLPPLDSPAPLLPIPPALPAPPAEAPPAPGIPQQPALGDIPALPTPPAPPAPAPKPEAPAPPDSGN